MEKLITVSTDFTSKVLFQFLRELGPLEVAQLIRGSMNIQQTATVLSNMACSPEWRQYAVMDLMNSYF
jgi:hypothetical protein